MSLNLIWKKQEYKTPTGSAILFYLNDFNVTLDVTVYQGADITFGDSLISIVDLKKLIEDIEILQKDN